MGYKNVKDAATRAVVGKAVDVVLNTARKDDREKGLLKVVDLSQKLMSDTWPESVFDGARKMIQNPDDKWMNYVYRMIDEVDPHVAKMHIMNAGYQSGFVGYTKTGEYGETHDVRLPWIILMDPTSACNKHCIGCWSAEYGHSMFLTYEDMDRVITEGEELGIYFWMMTGGEPLMRKADILKLAKKHNKSMFYAFTNGSLIDDEFCEACRLLGNISFALSIEGFEDANDSRRGAGSFEEVTRTMDMLKKHGLVFGTSICYTSANYKAVTSDEFLDFLIDKGVRYSWYFHYMPVGNEANTDLLPTPEQREYMIHRIREIRGFTGGKPIMVMDFQNDAEFVSGCIAGGKFYCHINPNGDVEPCVFIHYSNANIHDMSLEECLNQPIFKMYQKGQPFNHNHLRPCPMLENPEAIEKIVKASGAKSTDMASPEAVENLCAKCVPYAENWQVKAEELAEIDPHCLTELHGTLPDETVA